MEDFSGVTALTRGLLVLERMKKDGVLCVEGAQTKARLRLREGRVVALHVTGGDQERLGERLRRMGAWNAQRATEGASRVEGELFGEWGVRVGATDRAALSQALRTQLRNRMGNVFCSAPHGLALLPNEGVEIPALVEPLSNGDLVLASLRRCAASVSLLEIRRGLADKLLVLTPIGHELMNRAVLWPSEEVMLSKVRRGATVGDVIAATRACAQALRTLYALSVVGACATPGPRRGTYQLLLRKTRQMRSRASARELLEVPSVAGPKQVRKAWRRLARDIHPDRLGLHAPEGVREASEEVMRALAKAQEKLVK